jgi:hypothetical protein
MAKENDRSSPVRPFPRRAKRGASRPYLAFGSALALLRERTGKRCQDKAVAARSGRPSLFRR